MSTTPSPTRSASTSNATTDTASIHHLPTLGLVDGRGKTIEDPFPSDQTVVFFMRTADCPVCRRHVKELRKAADGFARRGVGVLVVVPDGIEEVAKMEAKTAKSGLVNRASFVVGSSKNMHDAVGLSKQVFGMLRRSGTFLVDGSGIVAYSRTSSLPLNAFRMTELEDAIATASDS